MLEYQPIWKRRHIDKEIIVFSEKDNNVSAGLAFDNPHNIVIRGRNGVVLKEGYDYSVDGNKIILLNKNIFYFHDEWLHNINVPKNIPNENKDYKIDGALLISPLFLREKQFLVEYDFTPSTIFRCISSNPKLSKTLNKLTEIHKLKIALFGDSISNAANSSFEMGFKGYSHWFSDVVENIRLKYPAQVEYVNISKSGYGTEWALKAYKEKLEKSHTDLVVIAFGMNDSHIGAEAFKRNIEMLIKGIKEIKDDTEFIVVASPLANKNCNSFYEQDKHFDYLKSLEDNGVTVVNMTKVSEFLLKRKRYCEISGNNLNHPNDFFYEFYTSVFTELFYSLI